MFAINIEKKKQFKAHVWVSYGFKNYVCYFQKFKFHVSKSVYVFFYTNINVLLPMNYIHIIFIINCTTFAHPTWVLYDVISCFVFPAPHSFYLTDERVAVIVYII